MSKRYFINNLDGLIGNSIIKQLTKSQNEEGEPEEEIEATHMGTYLDHNRTDKGRGVRKILKRHKPKLSRKKMLEECDVYIYDLNSMINSENKQDFSDIKYVTEVLKGAELEEEKIMILVSDVRVWSNTEKKVKVVQEEPKEGEEEGEEGEEKQNENEEEENAEENENEEEQNSEEKEEGEDDGEEGEKKEQKKEEVQQEGEEEEENVPVEYTSYVEADYGQRVPLDKYKKLKRMEDMILGLSGKENLKIYVICSGVLYGEGEVIFKNLFKAAWLQQPKKLPYLGEGDNIVPTIHVQDLAKFVIKVAENPPEEQKYLFAVDNSQKRTQKDIIQAIASGVGSGQIESVEKTDLINEHQEDIYKLNIDLQPSSLLVSNDEENPAEFEWFSEKGLIENHQKVLAEFWKAHELRPIKILMTTPEDERKKPESQYDWAASKISEHYRIPILKVEDIIKEAAESIQDDILGDDVREEQENLQQYLDKNERTSELNETMKVFYRVLKWRLTQNDCKNRGFILDDFPRFKEEADIIFFPQKAKKLERVRPKPKKMKRRRKQKPIDEQEEEMKKQKEKEEEELKKQKEQEEGEENGEEGEDNENEDGEEEEGEEKEKNEDEEEENKDQEEGEDEDQEEKDSQPDSQDPDFNSDDWEWYEVEDEPKKEGEEDGEEQQEEEEPEEEEEQEEEGAAPKREVFYPESFVFVKRMERKQDAKSAQSEIMDYFAQQNQEIFNYDMVGRQQFEIIEALRTYIERNTRPYNYLQPWEELKQSFDEFYSNKNAQILDEKDVLTTKQKAEIQKLKESREKICKEQIEYVKEHEGEIDIIKSLPFRNYLLEYVVPELNDGLVQVSNFLPDDPVEFLAEYLYEKSFEFSNN